MAAITRWVEYSTAAVGLAGDGRAAGCKGTRGYTVGTTDKGDTFTIGPTTNNLHLAIDGDAGPYITLCSGTDLDARFVARDITEKMHALGKSDQRWDNAVCKWENTPGEGNRLKIYSGTLGSSSSAIVLTSGTNSAHVVLGYATNDEQGGAATSNAFNGTASISGTYYGLFDEFYTVVVSNDTGVNGGAWSEVRGIDAPSAGGGNTYAGSLTTGGVYNAAAGIFTYTITIDTTNGAAMGAGTGNVPQMSWTSTGNADNSSANTELLYPDYWYKVGTRGLMVRFTDAVFANNDTWDIICHGPEYAQGSNASAPVGIAQYVWSSERGDMSSSPMTTISGTPTRLGSRGLYIEFVSGGGSNLQAGDEFFVICTGPAPSSDCAGITSLNYGNVTVSTESDVKAVMFEATSGAIELSTVKFGLQSHGSFSHHNAGNSDTYFRQGTVGPDNTAGSAPINGIEWYPNVVADDIDNDTPPSYLYATEDNLAVVATADLSEAIGNYPMCGLTSDPIWLNIHLGASETGANSSINHRLYFDYS